MTFERIGPTFERKKSYVWAQKNPRLSAFYRSYLNNIIMKKLVERANLGHGSL